MEQTVAPPTTLEVAHSKDCLRHYRRGHKYEEALEHRDSLRKAILDLLFSRHPGRVRLAAMRTDLPVFFHYWIMWSFLVGCQHAKAGLAENPRIRPRHGYVLAGRSRLMADAWGGRRIQAHLSFPLARNFKQLNEAARTTLLLNEYAITVIARLRGLTEMEYRKVALLGCASGADAILASNPDTPVSLLSWEVRNGTYWNRAVLLSNPSLPLEDLIWARNNWPSSTAWAPAVDEILNDDRWEEFQSWLMENGHEEMRDVPAQWAMSVIY